MAVVCSLSDGRLLPLEQCAAFSSYLCTSSFIKCRAFFKLDWDQQPSMRISKVGHKDARFILTNQQQTSMNSLDPELYTVLELATDAELNELSNILYGKSLLSPLLKTITQGEKTYLGHKNIKEERATLMQQLGTRFLFLGADAKKILRRRRPTYREVLLCVQMKLGVPCSTEICTEDLEAEIFLHLLQEYSRSKSESSFQLPMKHHTKISTTKRKDGVSASDSWQAALKLSGAGMLNIILRGAGVLTVSAFQRMVAKNIGGKVIIETGRYQVAKEILSKGGKAIALRVEAQVAVLAARQSLVGAASLYLALQRTTLILGPLLWGTFLAEMLIKSIGIDYARVVRAIYLFAQIRLLRTYGQRQAQ